MPTVPRAQRQVGRAPLPGARKTAAETPLSTGVGVELAKGERAALVGQIGAGVGRLGASIYGKIAQDARDEADEVAVLSADTALRKLEEGLLYDPNRGAFTRKGQSAFSLPEEVDEAFSKGAGEIEATLGTDRQRQAFARIRHQRENAVRLGVLRHVTQEIQSYEQDVLKTTLETTHSSAVANAMDPHRIGQDLQHGVDTLRMLGPRVGMSQLQIDAAVEKFTSQVHEDVIMRLVGTDQARAAQVYYEEAGDQITRGESITRIEKALAEGGLRQRSQELADQIIAEGGTFAEQRARVRERADDAAHRDATMQRIEHEAAVSERIDRERLESLSLDAYNLVRQSGGNIRAVPADVMSQLPGSTQSALYSFARQRAQGIPVETDLRVYYALIQQAGDDPESFIGHNLLDNVHQLGEAEFKQLAGLRLSMMGRGTADDKVVASIRTVGELVRGSLVEYGIDPSEEGKDSDTGRAIAQLRRQVDLMLEAHGKPREQVPIGEIQLLIDDLLSREMATGKHWLQFWKPETKPLLQMTPSDIPAETRTQIENALRRRGMPVSDATVLELFIEAERESRGGTRFAPSRNNRPGGQ